MADKKRDKNKSKNMGKTACARKDSTFDDTLERIKQETLSAVVEREVYPRGKGDCSGKEDDTQIYYTSMEKYRKTGRYEQDLETVAQHMEDRTQFRH